MEILINNVSVLLFLVAVIIAILATAGRIKTKWFEIDLATWYQRLILVSISLGVLVVSIYPHLLGEGRRSKLSDQGDEAITRFLVEQKSKEAFEALEELCFDEKRWAEGAMRRRKKDFAALTNKLGGISEGVQYQRIAERLRNRIVELSAQVEEVKLKLAKMEHTFRHEQGAETWKSRAEQMAQVYKDYVSQCALKNFLKNDEAHLTLLTNLESDLQQFRIQQRPIEDFLKYAKETMQITEEKQHMTGAQ